MSMFKVKLAHPRAKMPTQGSPLSAGWDVYAIESGQLASGAHGVIDTGLQIACPAGWYARVAPRSGLAVKYGINVHAGVIDADYRGTVKIALINHGDKLWEYRSGDRIAQIIFERCWAGELALVEELDETERGAGGFASTGL